MKRVILCVLMLAFGSTAFAGKSENPPKGPPWQRSLLAAQEQALKEGKPIFLYFTKTY